MRRFSARHTMVAQTGIRRDEALSSPPRPATGGRIRNRRVARLLPWWLWLLSLPLLAEPLAGPTPPYAGPAVVEVGSGGAAAGGTLLTSAPDPDHEQAGDRDKSAPDRPPAPLTAGQKMRRACKEAFLVPYSYAVAAALAGASYQAKWSPDYGYGVEGYFKRFGNYLVSGYAVDLVGLGVASVIFRQDPRYVPSESKGTGARLGHALASLFVTRSDGGRRVFNASLLAGVLAGAGVSTALHPDEEGRDRKFARRVGFAFVIEAGLRIGREFIKSMRRF